MRGPGRRRARNASGFGKRRSNSGRPMPTISSRPSARYRWSCWIQFSKARGGPAAAARIVRQRCSGISVIRSTSAIKTSMLSAALQGQRLICKHTVGDNHARGVEADAVPLDQIRGIGDDRIDVLPDLHSLVVIVLVQPDAGTDDFQDIEDSERPIAFVRA